jgi:hypothetical protein
VRKEGAFSNLLLGDAGDAKICDDEFSTVACWDFWSLNAWASLVHTRRIDLLVHQIVPRT